MTANSERARSEEQAREDERKKELGILEENALKRESKLEKILKKSKEKMVLIDESERQLAKLKEYLYKCMRFLYKSNCYIRLDKLIATRKLWNGMKNNAPVMQKCCERSRIIYIELCTPTNQ